MVKIIDMLRSTDHMPDFLVYLFNIAWFEADVRTSNA